MNVPALIEKMLVLFFAMAAGFVCGKRGWLDDTANRTISRLVEGQLAEMILRGELREGDSVRARARAGEIEIERRPGASAAE